MRRAATSARLAKALAGRADIDGAEHAWLNEAAIVELSGLGRDTGFRAGFDKMLGFAESKGWVRGKPRQIRAHIVWQS